MNCNVGIGKIELCKCLWRDMTVIALDINGRIGVNLLRSVVRLDQDAERHHIESRYD